MALVITASLVLTGKLSDKKEKLCGTCLERLEKNPMRLLDCKSPQDQQLAKDAPKITDYLCEECENHFSEVKRYLDSAGVEYTVNPKIVRGLDYYTRTVFEFVSGDIGAQSTVCGGGRYDGLVESLGGPALSGIGFGMGITRVILAMQAEGISARVVDMHTIKPLDGDIIKKAAEETGAIVVTEEHNIIGGLGAAVAEYCSENCPVPVVRHGVNDEFGRSGKAPLALKAFGLSPEVIAEKAKKALSMKK